MVMPVWVVMICCQCGHPTTAYENRGNTICSNSSYTGHQACAYCDFVTKRWRWCWRHKLNIEMACCMGLEFFSGDGRSHICTWLRKGGASGWYSRVTISKRCFLKSSSCGSRLSACPSPSWVFIASTSISVLIIVFWQPFNSLYIIIIVPWIEIY